MNKNYAGARSDFGDIAGIDYKVVPGFFYRCEHLIRVSEILAAGDQAPVIPQIGTAPTLKERTEKSLMSITKLYPNPTANYVVIDVELTETGPYYIELFDAQGKRALTDLPIPGRKGMNRTQLSLTGLEVGVYFVKVSMGDHTTMEKLFITR